MPHTIPFVHYSKVSRNSGAYRRDKKEGGVLVLAGGDSSWLWTMLCGRPDPDPSECRPFLITSSDIPPGSVFGFFSPWTVGVTAAKVSADEVEVSPQAHESDSTCPPLTIQKHPHWRMSESWHHLASLGTARDPPWRSACGGRAWRSCAACSVWC